LLDRDPAAHASISNLRTVAGLLDRLRRAAGDQVATLAARAAADGSLNLFGFDLDQLLKSLRKAGAA
jgi:hypothetical protein